MIAGSNLYEAGEQPESTANSRGLILNTVGRAHGLLPSQCFA